MRNHPKYNPPDNLASDNEVTKIVLAFAVCGYVVGRVIEWIVKLIF